MPIANTPEPPYYAVIFSSIQSEELAGYESAAARMYELATEEPGYLGFESARDGLGISVSYWKDTASIARWKMNSEHILAQEMGKAKWYASYRIRVCRVEREYGMG